MSEGAEMVVKGTTNAVAGLSQMVDQVIEVISVSVREIPANDIASLFGGRENATVAVYLAVTGSAEGRTYLLYPPTTALSLADLLLGQDPGTTVGINEMEASALGEMGNLMGSYYLNALSDASGLIFMPSPPAVLMDTAGAILDIALADIREESDRALVVETDFGSADRQISGSFLVLPSPNFLRQLTEHRKA